MTQAAACNLVDLKEARSNDRRWFKKLRLLIDEIERKNYIELLKVRHSSFCAMLVRSQDDDLAREIVKSIENLEAEIRDYLFPYFANKQESKDNKVIRVNESRNKRLKSAWEAKFGSLDDPETQRKIEEDIRMLRKSAQVLRRQKGT